MMQAKSWMIKAYELGKATADKSYEDIVYRELVPGWIFDDMDAGEFFEAGRQGHPFPEYRTGWRYGDIPCGGRSHNYREGSAEKGLSVMQIDGDEKIKTLAELRGSFSKRPVVRVGGWVNPCDVGGDGEPLLLAAEVIE